MHKEIQNQKIRMEVLIDGKVGCYAIQGKVATFGLRLTNIGDTPSSQFTISNISVRSAEGKDILEDMSRSFFINILNPNEVKDIDTKKFGSLMSGLSQVRLSIVPQTAETTISFFQRNSLTNEDYHIGNNHWIDFLYIKSNSEHVQETTNQRMTFLTYVLLILAIMQLLSSLVPAVLSQRKNSRQLELPLPSASMPTIE
jgi:hypothetical protein